MMAVTGQEPGEALWPITRSIAILREVLDEEITVECDQDSTVFASSNASFTMPGEEIGAFPCFVGLDPSEPCHLIKSGALHELLRRTTFAASSVGHSRFSATTGVFWNLKDSGAILVATDGRRLALANSDAKQQGEHKTGPDTIVPTKALNLLARCLADDDESVKVRFGKSEAWFQTERQTICTRLIEGRFPDYRKVIPNNKITAKVTTGPFMSAIRQAAMMTGEKVTAL